MLPPGQPIQSANSGDTDNSWTTESSVSITNSSRDSSPLDTLLEVPKSDSQQTFTADFAEQGDHELVEDAAEASGEIQVNEHQTGSDVHDTGSDVTATAGSSHQSETVDSGIISSEKQTENHGPSDTSDDCVESEPAVQENDVGMTISLPTAKGAACEAKGDNTESRNC